MVITRRWTIRAAASVLVLGAVIAVLWWAFLPPVLEVETAAATRGTFEEFIEDEARARVRERVAITLPWAGEIPAAGQRLAPRLRGGVVAGVLEQVPEAWLGGEPRFASAADGASGSSSMSRFDQRLPVMSPRRPRNAASTACGGRSPTITTASRLQPSSVRAIAWRDAESDSHSVV